MPGRRSLNNSSFLQLHITAGGYALFNFTFHFKKFDILLYKTGDNRNRY